MDKQTIYKGSFQTPPMRYHNKLSEEKVLVALSNDNGEWIAQEKKDGSFYQLEKIDNDHIYLFGRTISKKTEEYTEKSANVPHIINWAKENLQDGTILIGEIYKVGGHSNDVTKIMGALPARAVERQFNGADFGGPLHYYIFDIIRLGNEDLLSKGFYDRYVQLLLDSYKWKEKPEYIEIAFVYENDFNQVLETIFKNGGEGLVFKRRDSIYEPDKRPMTCFKIKEHVDSIDLICTGLEDPVKIYSGKEIQNWNYWWSDINNEPVYIDFPTEENTKNLVPVTKPFFYRWKNGMRLGVYKDKEIVEVGKVASGLTDKIRENMSIKPQDFIGKVVEISCMSVSKEGTLRHPIFLQVREDKEPKDCKWEEIFN